jgi:Na+/H+ antiporter NhaD/arsenite permease-like protein
MRHWPGGVICLAVLSLLSFGSAARANASTKAETPGSPVRLFISGFILDGHKEPVKGAGIRVYMDGLRQDVLVYGRRVEEARSSSSGSYIVEVDAPGGFGQATKIDIEVLKPNFKTTRMPFSGADFAVKGDSYHMYKDISIPRAMGPAFWIATIVFVGAYLLISLELLHRTIAAMLGAAVMLVLSHTVGALEPEYQIISFDTAISKIDMNVVFLLLGMMVIVGILKHTGVFQWTAYRCFGIARGNVFVLSVMFMTLAAATSAFLDNVTTMLLLTPVTIAISQALRINPLPLLVPEVMAANVGGTATFIGNPPNLMVGSYAHLTFMEFVYNLAIPCGVCMVALFLVSRLYYGRSYRDARAEDLNGLIRGLREEFKITDRTLLGYGLVILAFTLFLLITHGFWRLEVSVAALTGAALLFSYAILTKRVRMLELIERDIEWPSLLFFMFLFIMVGAVEEVGLLPLIADWVLELSQGNLVVTISLILWASAFLSAFVDNIPYAATMLPITAYLSRTIPGAESHVLWWALSLGACLGGNGTIVGSWSNVVTMGIAESAGYPISFTKFMKFGFVYMLVSVGICNAWLMLFY